MKYILVGLISLINVCQAITCNVSEYTLNNTCDFGPWLEWNCTSCRGHNSNAPTPAFRERTICCEKNVALADCLVSCNYSSSNVTDKESCDVCPANNETTGHTGQTTAETAAISYNNITSAQPSVNGEHSTPVDSPTTTLLSNVTISTSKPTEVTPTENAITTSSSITTTITTPTTTYGLKSSPGGGPATLSEITEQTQPTTDTTKSNTSNEHTGLINNTTTGTNSMAPFTNDSSPGSSGNATQTDAQTGDTGLTTTAVAAISSVGAAVGVAGLVITVIVLLKQKKARAVTPGHTNGDVAQS